MKKKTASTIICQNFKIPQQTIFQDYKCSFKSSLTYFGRLYIGEDHICFIANMFGILKKCVIEIQKIQKITEPSKFCLSIEQKQNINSVEYNFAGFKTNHAFTLIKALWKKQKIESEVLNSNDDEETFIIPGDGSEISKDKLSDQGNVESSFFNPKAIEADKQRLCEFQLPCSVEQYYNFFLADNATVYPRKKHLELRESKEITITQWRKSQELDSEVKQINALLKVNGVPFVNYAHLSQVWRLKKNEQNELFMEFVTQMGDVPYSNYFVVNNYLQIQKDGDNKCKMSVDMSIVFNKSTYIKNTILSRTIVDMKEDYNFWFGQVKAILEKMRKSQENQNGSKMLRNSRMTRASSEIQFQSNDISIFDPIVGNDYTKKPKISQMMKNPERQMGDLNKKIDKLTKIVILLLLVVAIQLVFNGLMIFKQFRAEGRGGKIEVGTNFVQMPSENTQNL